MNTAIIRTISLVCALTLWGCSASRPPQTLTERYQQLASDEQFSEYAMRGLAAEAFQDEDLPLMAKALWKLCQRGVTTRSGNNDCAALLDVAIIQQDDLSQARALLAHYFITGDRRYYQQAMDVLPAGESYYGSLFETSVAPCLNDAEATEWQAMQCYVAGKTHANEAALQKALTLFKRFGAQHNMADSYFLLARLKLQQNNPVAASDYAARAALLLSQLGETDKAQQIRSWRQDNIHAQ